MKEKHKNMKSIIKKEDVKRITAEEFDSVMRTILSTPPKHKKKKSVKK